MSERGHFPAQQDWVCSLSIMMQSVLFAAVRAPDGLRKNHPIKVIMRWYRRSILLSAFDGFALSDPFEQGGGSFTGPFTRRHAMTMGIMSAQSSEGFFEDNNVSWLIFNEVRKVYLDHVDEMPHHFQLHLMHAAQIVGEYHPIPRIGQWWLDFYHMIVNDAHLLPERREDLAERLSDDETAWRAREIVTAK